MAYFDNAATSYPKPNVVYSFMDDFYRNNEGSVGRGNYASVNSVRRIVDETRFLIQDLLHCPAKQVIFTPTATIALNMIIQGIIKLGAKNIYISPFEHNAVTRTLHYFEKEGTITVNVLTVSSQLQYDMERIKNQFFCRPPDLVIMSHVSNVIGLISPVEDIFALSKEFKAINVVDMSQSAGLVDIDVGLETIDFAVFAGHKTLFGPTGISGFVMKRGINLPSIIFGGTGFDSANQDMPESLPEKYEMGTLNLVGIAGLNAALKWVKAKTIVQINSEERHNRKLLVDLLKQYIFIKIVGNLDEREYVGIVSCLIDGLSCDIAGSILAERNIAVRTGLHCAPKAHFFLGTYPAGTIRFSVNCFTSKNDYIELKKALDDIATNL